MSILFYDFVLRALLAALFTGLAAPAVGTYMVQRRLALMGDGLGHIAVTGVRPHPCVTGGACFSGTTTNVHPLAPG